MATLRVGDIGSTYTVTITENGLPLDLTPSTGRQLRFLRPDNTVLAVTPAYVTDGTDGKLRHTFTSGQLSRPGSWQTQVHITTAGGEWHSDIGGFQVSTNLPAE
jgi:hypothetical protein